MNPVFIGIALIVYSNIYGLFLQVLHLKPSISNAIIYGVTGFLIAGFFLYINYNRITIGAVVVTIIGAIVSVARVASIIKKPSANS